MVEGHSVHRLASAFRSKLVGRKFAASSPNGRFVEGAAAINGRTLMRMEAVGKNLFAFFDAEEDGGNDGKKLSDERSSSVSGSVDDDNVIVVHVHFGMSGVWAIHDTAVETEPETKPTTRLRLEEECSGKNDNDRRFITHLSAMTVSHGPTSLYTKKKESLGEDPLRNDANPVELYARVSQSKKSVGALIMDQSYFAGPGNIYRAEILFLAGVYPTVPGNLLDRDTFDKVWNACVKLLRRGYDTGSILTVDASMDANVAARGERRYVYNRSTCARCGSRVSSWDMCGRTCYACEGGVCQPKSSKMVKYSSTANESSNQVPVKFAALEMEDTIANTKPADAGQHVPFISHCAPISYRKRLEEGGATNLTVAEIRSTMLELLGRSDDNINAGANAATLLPSKNARKSVHVQALELLLEQQRMRSNTEAIVATPRRKTMPSLPAPPSVSAEDAAREKLLSGENRGVEHIAELSREQAMRALSSVVTPSPAKKKRGGRMNDAEDDNTIGDDRKERVERRRRLKYDV